MDLPNDFDEEKHSYIITSKIERCILFDIEDKDKINKYCWGSYKCGNSFYAFVVIKHNGKSMRKIFLHRFILNLEKGDGKIVDHRNGNGLDNRKCNLRITTHQHNLMNQRIQNRNKSSKFKGVNRVRSGRWCAGIKLNQKKIYIGTFDSEIEAAKAYNKRAKELFGEFAFLNPV